MKGLKDSAADRDLVPWVSEATGRAKGSRKRVVKALMAMRRPQREALIMTKMDGLSYIGASQLAGVGLTDMVIRIRRAKEYARRNFDAGMLDEMGLSRGEEV